MCGIAGYLGGQRPDSREISKKLASSLVHRGPDDEGIERLGLENGRELLLVHRRLSIIDLGQGGHQPMRDPKRGNWIAHNGEIYNYKELRAELKSSGETFQTQSDTEVILKAYARWGKDAFGKLRGMFALALWDEAKKHLVLAVDPLGIKPLYWTRKKDFFAFSSEVRALRQGGLIEAEVNPQGLESYLAYGAVQGPGTILNGVHALQAGRLLTVELDGTVSEPRSYALPQATPEPSADRAATVGRLREILEDAVRSHLVSDVPVGVFLSGGIDSSIVAAFAKRHIGDLRTFSVVFDEKRYSEADASRAVAEHHRTRHTELLIRQQDCLAALPKFLDALDQPTVDGFNVYVLSKAVRDTGIKVVLSGLGGDELFAGYATFRWAPRATRAAKLLGLVPGAIRRGAQATWNAWRLRKRALPDKLGQFLYEAGGTLQNTLLLRQMFPPNSRRRLFPDFPAGGPIDGLSDSLRAELSLSPGDYVNHVSWIESRSYMGQMLLRDTDVMSMAHGLEARVPLLDTPLVDFARTIPGAMKVAGRFNKSLLVDAAGADLPSIVYDRPKQGFTFPWENWLRGELKPMADEALRDRQAFAAMGMNGAEVERLWESFLKHAPGLSFSRIWTLVALRQWHERMKAPAAA